MKKLVLLLIIATTLITSSCDSVLDLPSDGRLTMTQIFNDFDLSRGYVNKCYSYMPGAGIIGDYAMSYNGTLLASLCDEAEDVQDNQSGNIQNWYLGSATANSFPITNYWDLYYQGIRTCNIFLKNIETAPFLALRPALKGEVLDWKAQVHILRAFYFWQIVKRYGPAPILTKPIDSSYDYSQSKRYPFSECVDSIIADCEMAIKYNIMWNVGLGQPGDRGRVTRAVAYAIESEAALYAASDLWNSGNSSDKLAKWKWASKVTGKALNACYDNGYRLYNFTPSGVDTTSSKSAYQSYFFSRMDLTRTNDKETILECVTQLAMWRDAGLPTNSSSIRAGACPTQELVDAYEMKNGLAPFQQDEDGCIIYNGFIPSINTASGYDQTKPYLNRDPRLEASIYYNGALRNFADTTTAVEIFQNGNCQVSPSDQRFTRTGYYMRKFHNSKSGVNNQADGYMKIFRLAELYLNFAEAANEAYGPNVDDPNVIGSLTNAVKAVNAVRNRAKMPDFEVTGVNSAADFRKKYRNERRIELSFEQHRFYDVRRWMILEKTDKNMTGMNPIMNESKAYDYTNSRFSLSVRKCNESKFLMFPIPSSEVSKMEEYTNENWQNPQW
jgi:hypothetical protein